MEKGNELKQEQKNVINYDNLYPLVVTINNFGEGELKNVDLINPLRFQTNGDFSYIGGDLLFKDYKIACEYGRFSYAELNSYLLKNEIEVEDVFISSNQGKFCEKIIVSNRYIDKEPDEFEKVVMLNPYQFSQTCVNIHIRFKINNESSVKLYSVKPNNKITFYLYINKQKNNYLQIKNV